MIRYDLQCDKGHEFDAWFSDSNAYDKQVKRHLVECVVCGSVSIEKQIMAPGIAAKSNRRSEVATPMVAGPVDPRAEAMLRMMREFRAHIEKHAENVGENFAEEARKIHYRETEARGIMGKATPVEARELAEEGIDVHALPVLPEDGN
jgi:hypothetical protein